LWETRNESVVEMRDWNMGDPREVKMGIIGRSERWENGEMAYKLGKVGDGRLAL